MEKAWPNEEHRCRVVNDTIEKAIQSRMIREFKHREWDRFAKLYGCDKKGNVQKA
jgi:hypothetical protein